MCHKKFFNKKVGDFLKESRNSVGLSGREMSEIVRISQQQISRYENGLSSLTVYQLDDFLKKNGISWLDFVFFLMEQDKGKERNWDDVFHYEAIKKKPPDSISVNENTN